MLANIALLRLVPEASERGLAEATLTSMESRLQSMAALHKARCRSGNFQQIDLAVYLRQATSLRDSPPRSAPPGGWTTEPNGPSLVWSCSGESDTAPDTEGSADLEAAIASFSPERRGLTQSAVYACAIAAPPWLFRWRSPRTGTAGAGHLAMPGEVSIRILPGRDGVAVELNLSDCGPGLPSLVDMDAQRALSLDLGSILAGLVEGSLGEGALAGTVFDVTIVPSREPPQLPAREALTQRRG